MTNNEALPSADREKSKFFYGYVIVIAAFCVMLITSGIAYSYGVFVKPLIDANLAGRGQRPLASTR